MGIDNIDVLKDTPQEPPMRLCCGERHYGAQCPDGNVMCCICFFRVPVEGLSNDEDGNPQNVCKRCSAMVEAVVRLGHD